MNASNQKQQKPDTTDSLFGMALAQTFSACVFGAPVGMVWEACEVGSAIKQDRFEAKTPRPDAPQPIELGMKNSLRGSFAKPHMVAGQSLAEMERETFKPSFAPKSSYSSLAMAA